MIYIFFSFTLGERDIGGTLAVELALINSRVINLLMEIFIDIFIYKSMLF